MSATALAGALLVALALLAVGLNHLLARVGLIELALSQGRPADATTPVPDSPSVQFDAARAARSLPPNGLALFVTSTCVACARLVDDLSDPNLDLPFEINLYFADRRSPLARKGVVHEDQADLFAALSVPVTPYAVLTREGTVLVHGGVADLPALGQLLGWDHNRHSVSEPA